MNKVIKFATQLVDMVEKFEEENNVKIDVLSWGIGVTEQGEIIWGDENERNITVEYHDVKEN